MSKTLLSICAYGGLPFLRLGLSAVAKTDLVDVLVIQAKPGDEEMIHALRSENCAVLHHEENRGFAGAINDMLDFAFVHGDYDNLIIQGNDVIPLDGSIEAMVNCADMTDYEMVCGSEFNARFLVDNYPAARKFFHGENLVFKEFGARPWLLHQDKQTGVEPDTRKDIRNFTLFKRSSFEKVGYADVNFWPNAYYEDNDYGRRCDLLGVRACGLKEAAFFHFTSRTIHQNASRNHGEYFQRNASYFRDKWHGMPGDGQLLDTPFGGGPYRVGDLDIPCEMKISTRDHEAACIKYWSEL